ncbi:A/G-specific adenine glycosylase [Aromatoleum bremense]|uniref:Adenine DNA glycosylase n=1 Tax=Aromatoleum bremense TaxID=76115 RepID=A0ABX1P095_9RHOO|nr:A/G-specific adenine glycosylase [Aromatoleum bremense]NMG17691.1 A/G-specific adenine glycosylase [Aromatoleum bremense]QTQ31690.1 A/G-specific adenine glycosylase [Aromatoleum bremense]
MDTGTTFAARLIDWHRHHGRHDLPWQHTSGRPPDPYRIWLSEIMLQQTQVDTVIPYYARFLARFPDLATLAAAPVDDVLALWSGLGYYARARNLHKAAQVVVDLHGSDFPSHAAAIARLPGIGRSTAAAIAAFAFGERAAILDGNVKRVLCRVFGVDGFPGERAVEARLWALAESLLPDSGVGTYIQAQMDLGATVCRRSRPACARCPLADSCVARREDRIAELPAARPRKAVPQRRVRVAVIHAAGRVLLERRPPAGIWGGLLALPEIPDSEPDAGRWLQTRFGLAPRASLPLAPLNHAFTHFRLEITPIRFEVCEAGRNLAEAGHRWLALADLDAAGLPTPVRRILDALATGA